VFCHLKLGDEAKAMKELMSVARRAPASIDMRAALAALYWSKVCCKSITGNIHYTESDESVTQGRS
jgi:hypothetical protein